MRTMPGRRSRVEEELESSAPLAYTQSVVRYAPMTLVEMPEFIAAAAKLLSDEQREELLTHLANNPEAGAVMPETGGVRKLRWALPGKGKSGGVRVIYYYHNEGMPLLLLTVYPKSVKDNLTKAEKNGYRKAVPFLVKTYYGRRKK